jgi:Mor family transcriptional regulator
VREEGWDGRGIAGEMIEGCGLVVDRDVAVKAIREVCRHFGGQLLYVPAIKDTGEAVEELRGILRDAAGDPGGERMLKKIMALFGGYQIYIPREEKAFRRLILREIYEKYDGTRASRGALCREYNTTFNTIYRYCREWRDGLAQKTFEFEGEE